MSYLKVETLELSGFASALTAAHLPFHGELLSECKVSLVKKDNYMFHGSECSLSDHDVEHLSRMVKCGDEHAKVMRGIIAYAKIDAPIHFWWDLETYTVGHQRLLSASTQNTECKNLSGDALLEVKDNIPFGRQIVKVDFFSYQCLRHIYKQRLHHRNPQFRQFCEWIETLPFSDEFITIGLK